MKTPLIALAAALLAALAPPVSAQDRPVEHRLQAGGVERSYLLAAPSTASGPAPLVIALHGGGGNAGTMVPRWLSTAQREGFVVAFPQGLGRAGNMGTWNAGGCCGYAMTTEADDVAFIAAVIDDVSRRAAIDPRRIYVAGLSNGGMLTHRIAREIGPRLAGVAVVAGALFDDASAAGPVPILIMHGVRDEIVPYSGGQSPMALVARSQSRPFLPVEEAVASWRRADGCEGEPSTTVEGDVSVSVSSSCREGTEVVFYRLASAGHGWPGPAVAIGGIERDRYEAVDATEVIWRFFSAHSR